MSGGEFARIAKLDRLPTGAMEIEASDAELRALARRFGLPALERLKVLIVLRPEGDRIGVALLEHHYTGYLQRLVDHFDHGDGNYRDRLLAYYQHTLNQFCQQGIISGCLTVKLSAEVCDLSEDMRAAMDRGASQIIALLGDALEKGRQEGSLAFDGEAMTLSQVLYSLWLGANLQAKITRSATPLESALAHAKQIIAAPAV